MNEAQWLFMYHVLRDKERSWAETIAEAMRGGVRQLREMLIGVLGLNLVRKWKEPKGGFDAATKTALDDVTPYVPASFLFGRPQSIQPYLDEMQKEAKIEKAAADYQATQDDAFEEFSKRLAAGGDMEPWVKGKPGDDRNVYWNSLDAKQILRSLGVKPRVGGAAVPHISVKPKHIPKYLRPDPKIVVTDEPESPALLMERAAFGGVIEDE